MTIVDKIIIALYSAEERNMQHSGGKARLFIAKLVFCLLLWIWLLPILGILENNLGLIEISLQKPTNRIAYIPVLLLMYLVLNHFTVKIDRVDAYLQEDENKNDVKGYRALFLALIVVGFAFLVVVARYNQGNPLSD